MFRNFGRDDPERDFLQYDAEQEAELEAARHDRVVKCTATLWMEYEHKTEAEALAEANDFFSQLFRKADDAEFTCEEE